MARYDVYQNPDGTGYLLDVQTDLLDIIDTRVVVPLVEKRNAPRIIARLNPEFEIDGEIVVMITQLISAVPVSILHSSADNLSEHFSRITDAIDRVTHGY